MLTTIETLLFIIASISLVVSVVVLFKLNKTKSNLISAPTQGLIPNQSATLVKTLEQQSTKIDELEKQISIYKKPSTGVTLQWASPREDKSAYLLTLFNDFPQTIHNIGVVIEQTYSSCASVYSQVTRCESQKSINLFFLPAILGASDSDTSVFRDEFIKIWLENKLKPVEITVRYTQGPTVNDNYETVKIYFTRDDATKHLKTAIQNAKTRLTVVQTPPKKK